MLKAGLRSAAQALWANRTRSLLTVLGIVVGVGAVIAVVTLTSGTSAQINSRFAGLGTNTLTIAPGATTTGGVRGPGGTRQSLTSDDATALAAVPHVTGVSPVISLNNAQIVAGGQNWNTRVQGVTPAMQAIGNWSMAEGAWYTDADEQSQSAVAVIGQTIVDNLFTPTGTDPLGQNILISSQTFRVVGTLQQKGAVGAANQDDVVFVPFATARARLNNSQFVNQIQVQVDSADNVNNAQAAITLLLEQRHNLPTDGSVDDFTVRSSAQAVQTAQQAEQTLTLLLVGIAAISLVVGGIGIMNIMLVSVTERTREIGIRMAVGARRRDIRNQFLIEAVTLSSIGGAIGISIGLVAGLWLTQSFALPFIFNLVAIVLAFGVAAVVGILFGFYPAVRAARLDPIVALRTE
jgi:putative ABC transport system permease protein